MTPDEWAKCLIVLKAAYPTSLKLDRDGIGVWYDLLADLPGTAVLAAIVHMSKTTKAFPSIAEIRELADPRPGDPAQAWGEFIANVSRVGYVGTPEWSDPLIGTVVDQLGGWIHICQTMMTADEATWRAQFRRFYEAAAERAHRDQTFIALGVAPVLRALPSASKAVGQ